MNQRQNTSRMHHFSVGLGLQNFRMALINVDNKKMLFLVDFSVKNHLSKGVSYPLEMGLLSREQ